MTPTLEKQSFTPRADEAAQGSEVALPPGLIATALRAPLRRWPLSLAAAGICGVVAVLAGLAFSEKSWKAEGVLLYTPLPDSESLKKSYNPEKLESFFKLTGFDVAEVELNVDEVEFHGGSLRIKGESATKSLANSQRVSHARALGFEVFLVVGVRFAANRHLLHHFQAVTFQPDNFLRIVR